jgi:hypothetical protein
MYQMDKKYLKSPKNIPNGHKNMQTISNLSPTKIYPNWDFWFENKPPGNPDLHTSSRSIPHYVHISLKTIIA